MKPLQHEEAGSPYSVPAPALQGSLEGSLCSKAPYALIKALVREALTAFRPLRCMAPGFQGRDKKTFQGQDKKARTKRPGQKDCPGDELSGVSLEAYKAAKRPPFNDLNSLLGIRGSLMAPDFEGRRQTANPSTTSTASEV